MPLIVTQDLSEQQWHIAHTMAQKLVLDGADANELGKVNAYLNTLEGHPNPKQHFFSYLTTLAKNGDKIGHSKKTKGYYQSVANVCKEYIPDDLQELESLKQILGWTFRLMRYYKDGVPTNELDNIAAETASQEILSDRQQEIEQALESTDIQVGQVYDAEVTNLLKGKKVTYKILGTFKTSQKEPKLYERLSLNQKVKVEITQLKENGSIKKVKLVEC